MLSEKGFPHAESSPTTQLGQCMIQCRVAGSCFSPHALASLELFSTETPTGALYVPPLLIELQKIS